MLFARRIGHLRHKVRTAVTKRISIYDAETGELRRVLSRAAVRNIGGVTFSPDGKSLALGDWVTRRGGRVALYDADRRPATRMPAARRRRAIDSQQ